MKPVYSILLKNHFMSLATTYKNNVWIAPLFYMWDGCQTLFFVSHNNSVHVQQLLKNPYVAVSIFGSQQKEGNANGLQIKGYATQRPVIEWFDVLFRHFENEKTTNDKIHEYVRNNRAVFGIEMKKVFIQDAEYFKKFRVDKRIKAKM